MCVCVRERVSVCVFAHVQLAYDHMRDDLKTNLLQQYYCVLHYGVQAEILFQ